MPACFLPLLVQTASPRPEKKEVQLVDVKRSNNVNIGLAQFKAFGGERAPCMHQTLFRCAVTG